MKNILVVIILFFFIFNHSVINAAEQCSIITSSFNIAPDPPYNIRIQVSGGRPERLQKIELTCPMHVGGFIQTYTQGDPNHSFSISNISENQYTVTLTSNTRQLMGYSISARDCFPHMIEGSGSLPGSSNIELRGGQSQGMNAVLCSTSIPIVYNPGNIACTLETVPAIPQAGENFNIIIKNLTNIVSPYINIKPPGWATHHSQALVVTNGQATYQNTDGFSANESIDFWISGRDEFGNSYSDQTKPICSGKIIIGQQGLTPNSTLPFGQSFNGLKYVVTPCTVNRSINDTPNIGDNLEDYRGEPGIKTALGCVPTSLSGMSAFFFKIAVGLGGGIAFLVILFGGLQIMLSTGDPKKLQQGREIITAAVVGLLFIIFAVVILRIVGINILGIPGFS